ncbi:MAG TPA: alpha/beta hydrolase-fold protein [Streptomyces sp.]
MGLTSKKVLLLAAVLAVALFAVTVWFWPRLARRSLPAVLGRVAALLTTQFSLICVLGLAANYSFGFYASWADLFGEDTSPGIVVNHTSALSGDVRMLSTLHVNVRGGAVPRSGGQIQKVAIGGGGTGITATAYVYLPPQYFQQQQRVFPAVLVLTGYPGSAEALYKKAKYPEIAAGQVRDGKAPPTVLVMMRPTVAPPRDTECTDVPGGPQAATYFTKDLPAALSSHYRIGSGARSWGVMGDSTGGYCALKLAMRAPQAFSSAVGLSADYGAPKDATTGDLYGGSADVRRQNDLIWRLQHLPQPRVNLLVTSSKKGERNYRGTMRFIGLAKPPIQLSSIILPSGGHNFTTWAREIPPALQWLTGKLSAGA